MKRDKKPDQIKKTPVTYDDYANLPEDGNRYEIVEGTLQLMPPAPNTKHQVILLNLTNCFLQNCKKSGKFLFSPINVILSPKNVRQPDFVFVSNENLDILTEKGIEGTPNLVAEILSPSSGKTDKTDKRETYELFGIEEYWIIDPTYEILEQFILSGDKYTLHHVYKPEETVASPLVECISFQLSELF